MRFVIGVLSFLILGGLLGSYLDARERQSAPVGSARISYEPMRGSCSAVVLDDETAVTAAHCFISQLGPYLGPVKLHQDGLVTQANLLYISHIRDLALLKGDFKGFSRPPGVAGQRGIAIGRRYVSCGFPMGTTKLFCMELGDYVTNDVQVYVFKQPLLFGMSGGGVFDAETGELVGLNTALYPRSGGGGSAITPILGLDGERRAID